MKLKRRNFLSFIAATSLFSNLPSVLWSKISNTKYLILIELRGANDGLNTVIPYTDKRYYNLRPTLHINKEKVLTVTNKVGFHPSMNGLANLFENGQCKVVQNLGYPNPVLSHFRSIEIWETAGQTKGWLIDPLEEIAQKTNLDGKAMFLDDSGELFTGGMEGYYGPDIIGYEPEMSEPRDATIPIPRSKNIGLLGKILENQKRNKENLRRLKNKFKKVKNIEDIGVGSLSVQLSNVCRLIAAEVEVPVFKVSLGSFDTHSKQHNTHNRLLSELSQSIKKTTNILKDIGIWDNTIIMTYSEFGRRAKENGSHGTDHGMAAPHFVLGGKINGGIDGDNPNLAKLNKDNLTFSIDYRSLYDYVLTNHFELSENPFKSFRNSVIT